MSDTTNIPSISDVLGTTLTGIFEPRTPEFRRYLLSSVFLPLMELETPVIFGTSMDHLVQNMQRVADSDDDVSKLEHQLYQTLRAEYAMMIEEFGCTPPEKYVVETMASKYANALDELSLSVGR